MYIELRPIEFDFVARILIQLMIPKLFQFKHEISTFSVNMKITFDPNRISKVWQQIELFGSKNLAYEISKLFTLR